MQDRKRDYYYKKAKEEKYRSRASYKLLQANQKYHFMKQGDVVVDLGSAPGGWIQVASKIVGATGFVLGVDIRRIEPFTEDNVRTIAGDITDEEIQRQICELLPRKASALISDLSPDISGVWEVDHARQIDLAQQALNMGFKILKPSGNFFVKVFQGDMLDDFVKKLKVCFPVVKVIKPQASRGKSSEMFALGMGLKPEYLETQS